MADVPEEERVAAREAARGKDETFRRWGHGGRFVKEQKAKNVISAAELAVSKLLSAGWCDTHRRQSPETTAALEAAGGAAQGAEQAAAEAGDQDASADHQARVAY
jgi:hypothetical protein